jgi:isoleucyl-tRNA synthetase
MSKSKGNIVDPMEVMDKYGADMLRWMLYTINQPGLPKRFDIKGMNEIMNRVFRMLWNSYSFFILYANIDKFQAKKQKLKVKSLLDKWIISELNMLIKDVDGKLEKYDIYGSAKNIEKFIDNLSNWYIRRSRKRFWKSEDDNDKNEAYQTLHYVLVELSKLMAPFTPFVAEEIYKNLTGEESVHLAEFPVADEKLIDEKLNIDMDKARLYVNAGLKLRADAEIKVRQPLYELFVKDELSEELFNIISEEVNVKKVKVDKNIDLAKLNIHIDNDLKLEGQAREIIRFIQEMRKEAGYEVDNRIKVCYAGMSEIFEKFGDTIKKEVLAEDLREGKLDEFDLEKEFNIEDGMLKIQIKR